MSTTLAEKLKIIEFLKSQKEWLNKVGPTFPQVMRLVKQKLQISISVKSLEYLVKVSDINWDHRRLGKDAYRLRYAGVLNQIANLHQRLSYIEKQLGICSVSLPEGTHDQSAQSSSHTAPQNGDR